MIPMVDLKTQYHQLKAEIDQAVLDALESTQFILGPNVTSLEKRPQPIWAVPMGLVWLQGPMPCIWRCWQPASSLAMK